ncbi:MAG: hypothetical protein IMZ75_12680, partial [Actinobacteria bacterium]|nr:hypothetical protein [Actinomycetota bacterium]
LTTITPTISVPKAPITITGSVRNAGSVPITSPVTRALIGQRPLASRQAVSDWATSTQEQPLAEVARTSLGKTLAPGAVARFALTVPASAINHRESFAVLPLRVDVVGTTPTKTQETQELGDLNTFLPALAAVKAFEPLSIAWLVPLTLEPDPALHGMDSPARTAAWTKAIGPGSRLDRLITGTDSTSVTWAIDPAILGPQQTPTAVDASATPGPTPSASNPPTPERTAIPDPVAEATTALARRLRAAAPRHAFWSLPYADPDLAALLPLGSGNRTLAALISHPSTLNATVGPARTGVAWPVDGTLTTQREAQLRLAFSSPGLAAAVTSASTRTNQNGYAGDASRKSSGGLALLVYDEALSGTFTQTSSTASGAITVQRFLADSMALLGERPGTRNRSVLVAAPRTFAGDPTVLRSLFAAIAKAPWLTPTTTEHLLAVSGGATPEVAGVGSTDATGSTGSTGSPTASPTAPDPLRPGTSPLTAARLDAIPSTLSAITGIASILDSGQLFKLRWTDAQDQLLSARWRDHPDGPTAIEAATTAAISAVSRNVNVAPSSVNFFADRGVLQVTVVNNLSVPIHNVHLKLTPDQPRLRIEQQPGPLKIGAGSRATVPLRVTAIASGLVPIQAALTTSNGTPLGQNARVNVRVQPTSTWIYWALGGLGGLVLVLGTYRSLRRGSTRASRHHVQKPSFND